MNRLWVRLTLAFIFVALISAAVVAVLATTSADNQFREYLNRRDTLAQSGLLTDLSNYYQRTGSWTGAESILANFSRMRCHQGGGSGLARSSAAAVGRRAAWRSTTSAMSGDVVYGGELPALAHQE
jgi:hypothetical protein